MKLSQCGNRVNGKNKRTDCKALCCSSTCPAFIPGHEPIPPSLTQWATVCPWDQNQPAWWTAFFGLLPQVTYGREEDAEPLWLNRFIWLDSKGQSFTNWVLSSTYGKQILQLSSMIMFCNSQLNGPLLNSSVDSITRSKYNSLNT